jgi:hypothetical protein
MRPFRSARARHHRAILWCLLETSGPAALMALWNVTVIVHYFRKHHGNIKSIF